jgi:hypothetical protein
LGNNDSESNLDSEGSAKQPCRVCREPIPLGAIKCTLCSSYQDWTRYLLRWSTITVAILALVPLWGSFQSLHQIAFGEKGPHIQAALTTCHHEKITAAYINAGSIDGIVTDISFTLGIDGKDSDTEIRVLAKPDGDFVVSPSLLAKLVDYQATIGGKKTKFVNPGHGYSNCHFNLTITWSEFSGRTRTLKRSCRCPA